MEQTEIYAVKKKGEISFAAYFTANVSKYAGKTKEELAAELRQCNRKLDLGTWDGHDPGISQLNLVKEVLNKKYRLRFRRSLEGIHIMAQKNAPKKNAPEKAAAPEKNAEGEEKKGRGRNRKFQPEQKITILAKENPKRAGSTAAERFALYKNGMTVKAALEAGVKAADLSWDAAKGHISIA